MGGDILYVIRIIRKKEGRGRGQRVPFWSNLSKCPLRGRRRGEKSKREKEGGENIGLFHSSSPKLLFFPFFLLFSGENLISTFFSPFFFPSSPCLHRYPTIALCSFCLVAKVQPTCLLQLFLLFSALCFGRICYSGTFVNTLPPPPFLFFFLLSSSFHHPFPSPLLRAWRQ